MGRGRSKIKCASTVAQVGRQDWLQDLRACASDTSSTNNTKQQNRVRARWSWVVNTRSLLNYISSMTRGTRNCGGQWCAHGSVILAHFPSKYTDRKWITLVTFLWPNCRTTIQVRMVIPKSMIEQRAIFRLFDIRFIHPRLGRMKAFRIELATIEHGI